jgi:hypothetical protein
MHVHFVACLLCGDVLWWWCDGVVCGDGEWCCGVVIVV